MGAGDALATARGQALIGALFQLSRGDATAADIGAALETSWDAALKTAFDDIAGSVVSMPPSLVPQTGKTGVVSLLSTGTHEIDMPAIAGKRAILLMTTFVIQPGRTGTATGNLVFSVGTNAPSHDNMIASTSQAAGPFNGTTFALPFALNSFPAVTGMPDMTVKPSLRITTALGGASVLQGRYGIAAWYV